MEKKTTYHEQKDVENILRLREVLTTLPPFCRDYFRAIDTTTTTKTRISYAYDIRIFFQFLLDENPAFKDYKMTDFTVDVLDQIKALDLEEYQEYLKVYQAGDKTETNGERGLSKKNWSLKQLQKQRGSIIRTRNIKTWWQRNISITLKNMILKQNMRRRIEKA